MSDGEYSETSIIGRSYSELLSTLQNLQSSLREEFPTPTQRTPRTHRQTQTNALSIPKVDLQFSSDAPFSFPGYPVDQSEGVSDLLSSSQQPRYRIPTTDQAYICITDDLLKHIRFNDTINTFKRFMTAIPDNDDSIISQVWEFLYLMTSKSRPTNPPFLQLLKGARIALEKRFLSVMTSTSRHYYSTLAPGSGIGDAHLCISLARNQLGLDLNADHMSHERLMQEHGWRIMYIALRCGNHKAIRSLAEEIRFPPGLTIHTPQYIIDTWTENGGCLPLLLIRDLSTLCEAMANNVTSSEVHYIIRVLSFLCGNVDVLLHYLWKTSLNWDSLDEFLWFCLGSVRHLEGEGEGWIFDLKEFQKRINQYSEDYYTEGGKSPMRYIMALLCSLQFKKALRFMFGLEDRRTWFVHGVHLAVALETTELMDLGGENDEKEFPRSKLAAIFQEYAFTFRQGDKKLFFQYKFFSRKLGSGSAMNMETTMLNNMIEQITEGTRPGWISLRYLRTGRKAGLGVVIEEESLELIRQYAPEPNLETEFLVEIAERLSTDGNYEYAYRCYRAAGLLVESLRSMTQMIAVKISEMLSEQTNGLKVSYASHKYYVSVMLNQFNADMASVANLSFQQANAVRTIELQCEALSEVYNMMKKKDEGLSTDAVHIFCSLKFMPSTEDDIGRSVDKLVNEYPLLMSVLHKVMLFFCFLLTSEEYQHQVVRPDLLRLYQRFTIMLPDECHFKTEVAQHLGAIATRLSRSNLYRLARNVRPED